MAVSYNTLMAYTSRRNKELQDEERAANNMAAQAAKEQIQAAKKNVNATSADAVRQAYVLNNQHKNRAETDTAKLGLQANTENLIRDIGIKADETQRNLDVAQMANDAKIAKANAEMEARLSPSDDILAMRLAQVDQTEKQKQDYVNNVSQYQNDFQAEINRLREQGVPDSDYRIQALNNARNEKIEKQNFMNAMNRISAESGYTYDFDADIYTLRQMGFDTNSWQILALKEAKRLQAKALKDAKAAEKASGSGGGSGSGRKGGSGGGSGNSESNTSSAKSNGKKSKSDYKPADYWDINDYKRVPNPARQIMEDYQSGKINEETAERMLTAFGIAH